MILTERGLGGADPDLRHRLEAFERDRSPRARDAKALAARWVASAPAPTTSSSPGLSRGPMNTSVRQSAWVAGTSPAMTVEGEGAAGLLLAEAYPERVAKARGKPGEFLLAGGRGAFLDPTDALAREPFLAVGELGSGAARDRILLAAPVDEPALRRAFEGRLTTEQIVEPDAAGRLKARRRIKLGALVLEERLLDRPPEALIAARLMDQLRAEGLSALPWPETALSLRARAAFLNATEGQNEGEERTWPDLSDAHLLATAEDWLAPLLAGRTSLAQIDRAALADTIRTMIGWERLRALDAAAPERLETPAGTSAAIDYAAEGGPRVEVRVQELFGLDRHPALAGGKVPLTLALLSPARRPIQITKDLPGFWRGSWKAVRTEMKGRYPRHPWPDEPWTAQATTRAKPRG